MDRHLHPLDAVANVHRQRRKPQPGEPVSPDTAATGENEVELAYRDYHDQSGEDS